MDRTRRLVANACRVTLWTEAVMADRPQMLGVTGLSDAEAKRQARIASG